LDDGAEIMKPCKLCNGTEYKFYLSVERANFSSRIQSFNVYRCVNCSLFTMEPYPSHEDIKEIYVQERIFSKPIENPNIGKFLSPWLENLYAKHGSYYPYIAKECINQVASKNKPLKILDVGCSTGKLLYEFQKINASHKIVGIDIDPDAKEKAIPKIKENIIVGNFVDFPFPDGEFDIVTLCFVIEHLLDIQPYIEKALRVLKKGGLLFISTPDILSAKAIQMKDKWRLLNDDSFKTGHVNWFNRKAIEYLSKLYKLKLLKYRNRGEFLHYLPVAAQNFLRKTLGTIPSPSGERFIRWYQIRVPYAILFDGLLSQTFSWGDTIYAFLQKDLRENVSAESL
jgi:ubiquinone/menaquinone biosynthesis C-methylase UbiE